MWSRPTPHITWRKDGEDLVVRSPVKAKNFNKMIQIPKASFEDAGDYVCTATNKLDYIQHTITVQVKGETLQEARGFSCNGVDATKRPIFDSCSVLVGETWRFGFGPWGKWTFGVPLWRCSSPHPHLVHQRRANRPWAFAWKKWGDGADEEVFSFVHFAFYPQLLRCNQMWKCQEKQWFYTAWLL